MQYVSKPDVQVRTTMDSNVKTTIRFVAVQLNQDRVSMTKLLEKKHLFTTIHASNCFNTDSSWIKQRSKEIEVLSFSKIETGEE